MRKSIVFQWITLSISTATAGVAWFDGGDIDTPLRLLDATRDAAAIVFGASGIWISLLYPEALKSAMSNANRAEGLSARMRFALAPLMLSAIVTVGSLVVPVIFERFRIGSDIGSAAAYSVLLWWFLIFNTSTMVGAILLALGPGQWLYADVGRVSSRHRLVSSLLALTQAGRKRSGRQRAEREDANSP